MKLSPTLISTQFPSVDTTLSTSSSKAIANSAVATALASKQDVTTVQTESGTDVSLTLANNTLYQCTNVAIETLTIVGVATGFEYASLIFNSPSTATVFSMPDNGYYCSGVDCEDGEFIPEASMRYNLAIHSEFDRIAIYVVGAL